MNSVTDNEYCDKCKQYFASLEVHNDFWHQDEPDPLVKWDNSQFVLICEIKNHKGTDTWFRVFGPFPTRGKAVTQKNKMIRAMKEDYRSDQWIKDNVKFVTTTIWKEVS